MSELQPVDLKRPCPKCGGGDIGTRWHSEDGLAIKIKAAGRHPKLRGSRLIPEEHIERVCRTCQYRWAERPLDGCSAVDRLAAIADQSPDIKEIIDKRL